MNFDPNTNHLKLVGKVATALVRSAQQMTLQEKRLLLLVISQMRQDDDNFARHSIPITAVHDFLELKDKDTYTRLKEITKKLLSRVLEMPNEKGWQQFQWVSHSKIGEAGVEIQLHEHLRPLLLNLKRHFGSVPLLQIAPMPSLNSIRIFDILWFASRKLTKTELYFPIEVLKKHLDVEENYNNFKDFRREVLDRAQRHCAEHSPLSFSWTEDRKGRKVIGLRFFLNKTENFDAKWSLPLFKQTSSPPARTTESTTNVETLKKPDWNGVHSQKMPFEEEQKISAQEKNLKRQAEPSKSLPRQALEEQYKRERQDAIDALYKEVANRLDFATEKAEFVDEKLRRIKAFYDLYQTQGLENPGLLASFKNFLAEKYLKPEYRSFENWCETFHSEQKA